MTDRLSTHQELLPIAWSEAAAELVRMRQKPKASIMVHFLAFVSLVGYGLAAFWLFRAVNGNAIDLVLAGIFAICGTLALGIGGVIVRLDELRRGRDQA